MKYFGLIVIAALAASPASAKNICSVAPGQKWIPLAQAKKIAAAAGYTRIRMGVEAGCYEAEAQKNGVHYEVYIHPVSGKIVMARKDID